MTEISIAEYLKTWDPIFSSIYHSDSNNLTGFRYGDPTWRMVPLPGGPGMPLGPKNWLDFRKLPKDKRQAVNHYEPFCQGLRAIGVSEVVATCIYYIDRDADFITSFRPKDEALQQNCAATCPPDISIIMEDCAMDYGEYESYTTFISKEANWTLTTTGLDFSWLGAPPDIMQTILEPWGGEEAVYKMFCDYDMGGEFYFQMNVGYNNPEIETARQGVYALAGWQAPFLSREETERLHPWTLPEWDQPAWREAHGFSGPRYSYFVSTKDKAEKEWQDYLAQKESPHR